MRTKLGFSFAGRKYGLLAYSSVVVVLEEGTYCEGLIVEARTDCEESIVEAIKEALRT